MAGKTGRKHAFLIAGTHSGCGKTTITLGLLAALRARGLRIQPFKVGPDFIDPGLHTQIAGTQSRNLDGWMLSREYNVELFRGRMAESDVGIVEGVMGLFDGYEGATESGSSAEMAKWLGIPAILVVDARSMARSAAALLHGFKNFDPALNLCGVIFNRVGGQAHLEYLKEAVGASFPELPILGGIPREEAVVIPERHLGLVTADEMGLNGEWRDRLAELVERFLDLDLLMEKSVYDDNALMSGESRAEASNSHRPRATIAVARDAAFCFYYSDNFELLENAGARLRFFSPIAGENIPDECSGVYLGGGYPEIFADAISRNTPFLATLRERAARGMPVYAECGGLMTLGRSIETLEGKNFRMAGILPFGTRMLARRKALGYTEVVLRKPCLLGGPGMRMRGHEFHYSEITEATQGERGLEKAYELRARKFEKVREEGYTIGGQAGKPAPRVLASYIHLHWGSAPEAARNLVDRCAEWKDKR